MEDYDQSIVVTPTFLLLLSNVLTPDQAEALLPSMLERSSLRSLIHAIKFPRSAGINDFVFNICCLTRYTNQVSLEAIFLVFVA